MVDPLANIRVENQSDRTQRGIWFSHNRRGVHLLLGGLLLALAWVLPYFLAVLPAMLGAYVWLRLVVCTVPVHGVSMHPAIGPDGWGIMLGHPLFAIRRDGMVVVAIPGFMPLAKRVAGLAGDELVFRNGGVFRKTGDGEVALPLTDLTRPNLHQAWGFVVPEGHIFLLGDHVCSADSRHFGTVTMAMVQGRFIPVRSWGKLDKPTLSDEEKQDLAVIQATGHPFAERLTRMIEHGGYDPGTLTVALRLGLLEAADLERVDALLERSWTHTATSQREAWTNLLASMHFETDPIRSLSVLDRHFKLGMVTTDEVLSRMRSILLARLGRWQEALDQTQKTGAKGLLSVRVSASIGLEMYERAAKEIELANRDNTWDHPSHRPYYAGLLAAAQGQHRTALPLLLSALDAEFDSPTLMRTTPHLAAFRDSECWVELAARLPELP